MRPTELDHGLTSSRFARLIAHSDWHHLHLLPQLAVRTRSLLLLRTRLLLCLPLLSLLLQTQRPLQPQSALAPGAMQAPSPAARNI